MTEPKKFTRGKHSYTRYGSKFKEVRVEGKKPDPKKEALPAQQIQIGVDAQTEVGVYSNVSFVRRSPEEVILDFGFIPPGQNRGKIRSRVIMPPKHVAKLAKVLNKAMEEINNTTDGH